MISVSQRGKARPPDTDSSEGNTGSDFSCQCFWHQKAEESFWESLPTERRIHSWLPEEALLFHKKMQSGYFYSFGLPTLISSKKKNPDCAVTELKRTHTHNNRNLDTEWHKLFAFYSCQMPDNF